ncbi:MAG: hypothetical protein IJY58_02585 [Alphaproteobacteria bacterium]|nr:hypothetical protein [Alphaproteobacteria bacterium]MBQ9089915.1 hypothetical protein [Alphaproteobacteria bacterium]
MKIDKSKILFCIQWGIFYILAIWWLFFGGYLIYDVLAASSFRYWGAEAFNHWSTQSYSFYALDLSSVAIIFFLSVAFAYILRKTYYIYALMFLLVLFVPFLV